MSSILYYSNYCENCKALLQTLSKSNVKDMAEAFRTVELGWKELIQSFPRSSSTRLDLEAT